MAETLRVEENKEKLNNAKSYGEIWELVKKTAKEILGKQRVGMMLFLDDLPLNIGAYHPYGTNNIVLNRALVQIVEATTNFRRLINAFIYVLLLHEYLHALGYIDESEVRPLVYQIAKESFSEEHVVTKLALKGPWSILSNVPLHAIKAPKRIIEIVKDFEKDNQNYIS